MHSLLEHPAVIVLTCVVLCYRKDLEENSEELIRIKECYVQLGEESRGLEHRLKEGFEKEKQMLLSEVTSVLRR